MRGRVLAALAALAAGVAAPATAAQTAVRLDRGRVATQVGREFGFSSTITNGGARTATGLIAHLNVLSLDPGVYVDPEDWSSSRTRYLPPLAAGASRRVAWTVDAVNGGRFAIYVSVVPRRPSGAIAVSAPLRARVAGRPTLDAGGVLPLAISLPAALAILALLGVRRRRART